MQGTLYHQFVPIFFFPPYDKKLKESIGNLGFEAMVAASEDVRTINFISAIKSKFISGFNRSFPGFWDMN